eukprot:CAMPEP_0195086444 /NCGR_PEP_ID=MMETSP0448-20130528/26578_1 /TAXON_ID=66468 /ORGANISM="Heterocapsa triquestra, Strain CCMP 448" /LENGTH=894 /DNA_ID=CAMNT_0040119929 /DNA_START=141 /DNA_END=2823 /DNA_ORIENTATION=+
MAWAAGHLAGLCRARYRQSLIMRLDNTLGGGGGGAGGSHSVSVSKTKAKGMAMLRTTGIGMLAMQPSKLDKAKLGTFRESLHLAGVDTSHWGTGGAKSIEHLFWEVHEQKGCVITGMKGLGRLKRITRLVKIHLQAEIFGVEHTLYSRMQFMHDGQTVERKQVPLRKLAWSDMTEEDLAECTEYFYKEGCQYTEDWRMGCRKALEERLGLSASWQEQYLVEEPRLYTYTHEDNVNSDGYPGLNTLYCIHEVTFRITQTEHPNVQCIGLPEGQEFATTEGDFNFTGQLAEDGLPIGSQLNIWSWGRDAPNRTVMDSAVGNTHTWDRKVVQASEPVRAPQKTEEEIRLIRRVPLPKMSAQVLAGFSDKHALVAKSPPKPPSTALWSVLEGKRTDWTRVRKMAKSIADPKYTLQQFNEDVTHSFPELNIYLLDDCVSNGVSTMNSGRTIGDEFQRTIGAFFAIFWLMRLDVDGKEGFSFGVKDDWKPNNEGSSNMVVPDKRVAFYKQANWDYFKQLLLDAGLLEHRKGSWGRSPAVVINEKRLASLLALTAIHDIMKMGFILPIVQADHAPYHGYAEGDRIGDHDHALSYIMDHYSEVLPSFRGIEPEDKRAVQFTQCNLCFNHGWFVQAEAPPGAIFTTFREALIRDHRSELSQQDVALYFVHWLTDLAGAEPTPLGGCEKFVIKFPLPVLNSFLRSFEFVGKIATQTETEVVEEYLKTRWLEHQPSPGPLPTGDCAIAKMRLLCMSQMNAGPILRDFDKLTEEDRDVLNVEMSRTGVVGQSYSEGLCPKEVRETPGGPAFLIYYGPALLQNLGNDSAVKRLSVLAEIYRCARELWPLDIKQAGQNVTIRIDMIKSLSTQGLLEAGLVGDVWLMVKHNKSEAFIERSSKKKLNKMI